MNELNVNIARNLREIRRKYRLTQAEAAEKIGVAFRTYQNYEGGLRIPKPKTLKEIEKVFGLTQEQLFGKGTNSDKESNTELSASELASIMNQITSLGPAELEILRNNLSTLSKAKKQIRKEG